MFANTRTTDKLHNDRLLNVEEKPFKRVTKRLLASNSPIQAFYTRLPTPPADEAPATEDYTEDKQAKFQKNLQKFRTDVILDFAAFDASIARIQFLHAANEKERERYAAEKLKIEATAQDVRENTAQLRVRLDEAQKTLATRKTYDLLAENITKDKALKTRDEQRVNIEKLKGEIEDLEREGREANQAWVDRRSFFDQIVGESQRLRRLIRDEKDEPEHDPEKHEEDGDDEDMLRPGGHGEDEPMSNVGTPRPIDEASTPAAMHSALDSGVLTPRSTLQAPEGEPAPHSDMIERKEPMGTEDVEMAEAVIQINVIEESGATAGEMDTT
jgi:primosomal protein N''